MFFKKTSTPKKTQGVPLVVKAREEPGYSLSESTVKQHHDKSPSGCHSLSFPSTKHEEKKAVKRATKSVRFDLHRNKIAIRPVLSENDRRKCWYRTDDYKSVIAETLKTVDTVSEVKGDIDCLDQEQYCIRGLENELYRTVRDQQKERIETVIRSVIEHQKLYAKLGFSAQSIAGTLGALSKVASAASQKRAQDMAVMDFAAIYQCNCNNNDPNTRCGCIPWDGNVRTTSSY